MLEAPCLLGCSDKHVVQYEQRFSLQAEVYSAIQTLFSAASKEGFDIRIASGYRSYQKQREIWNLKASGAREVLDDHGKPMVIDSLDDRSLVFAILRWSALPGASRHHWGTDFDIYDAAALGDDGSLSLTVEETEQGGPFYNMYCWLDDYLRCNTPFFRPYAEDLGGVAREPWHLSYSPLADVYFRSLSKASILDFLKLQDFALKSAVIESFDEIYERFIANICQRPE